MGRRNNRATGRRGSKKSKAALKAKKFAKFKKQVDSHKRWEDYNG